MRTNTLNMLLLLALLLLAPSTSAAMNSGTADPAEVMREVRERNAGADSSGHYLMKMYDASGGSRRREVRILYRDEGEIRKTIIRIESPARETGTSFLSYSYDELRDDDQWLYLPSLRRTRQIANQRRTGAFLGSDFTYADMERFNVSDYQFALLGEEQVSGRSTLKIEAVPYSHEIVAKVGYSRRILWVDASIDMIIKELNYDENGLPLREIQTLELDVTSGIYAPALLRATNLQEDTYTELKLHSIEYDLGLDSSRFSRQMLQYLR